MRHCTCQCGRHEGVGHGTYCAGKEPVKLVKIRGDRLRADSPALDKLSEEVAEVPRTDYTRELG